MKNDEKKIVYAEPADYFPKEIRKKYKLGEFAEPKTEEKNREKAILKELQNPNLSKEEKNALVEELYRDIPII